MVRWQVKKQQINWINCAKCVAILAVMLDHTYSMLYSEPGIQRVTQFAVPLFVLLSGITSYISGEKYVKKGWISTFWHKIKRILPAYLLASLIYSVVMTKTIDLYGILSSLIHFNASGPLYYVALYLQLMFLFWPLLQLLSRIPVGWKGAALEMFFGIALLVFSIFTTNNTNLLGIAGGGGKLFGGTFLFLFYLGMVMEKHQLFRADDKNVVIILCSSLPLVVLAFCVVYNWNSVNNWLLPIGNDVNPPGFLLMGLSVIFLLFFYAFFSILEKSALHNASEILAWIGQHTLYLYLYHKLFLDTANHFLRTLIPLPAKWLVYFAVMMAGPLLMERAIYMISFGVKKLVKAGDQSVEQR